MNPEKKSIELPEKYLEEMRRLLGETELKAYLTCMEEETFRGIRLNPLKVAEDGIAGVLSSADARTEEPVPWSDSLGYYYEETGTPARHPYYYGGLYYLQEPSAMAPGAILPVEPGDRVMDLCAAPGGKSTQLGARLAGSGFLLSNDISASRANGLLKNLERFGIGNILVSSEEPKRLLRNFPEYFDKILVDAPCSGEGMFRREPSMIRSWMEKGPEHYSPIQKELLRCACGMLKPGGMLLYSTCTFAAKEDEDNIEWIRKEIPELEPVPIPPKYGFVRGSDGASIRLFPWRLSGEGHFLSLLRKKGRPEFDSRETRKIRSDDMEKNNRDFLKKREELAGFLELVHRPIEKEGYFWEREGQVYLLPVPKEELPPIRFLRTGLLLGTLKKKRFEPSQALAMYLKKEEFENGVDFPSEDPRTVKYLKGETVEADNAVTWGKDGWCLVCTDGYPLGFAKRSRMTLKNKYYPGWRWQ
ncbi:RsmB/NOP family class I SAM-dependent RNA methyltransferase [Qiania dongpingensis]|uniref:RsmF rRNA methyltransferase first C-terminal domain-containing protein n=1 Tax=Qiania dongpingensis TaxID=2763669 RepID=A0A7G9G4K5_9FIRM|nr:RsmB/NOP family class I SAM-dependent RNA methyltransferase [Qiania dongpingensis]QNM05737.1 RsmF rRNA methyltransferase first C-terminal domain-containing protein [Qiania dongpingensis]